MIELKLGFRVRQVPAMRLSDGGSSTISCGKALIPLSSCKIKVPEEVLIFHFLVFVYTYKSIFTYVPVMFVYDINKYICRVFADVLE